MIGRVFSIALLSALACIAQEQTATLTGTVTDPFGSPITGAKARLYSEDRNGLNLSVDTDSAGRLRFADIPPGSYQLTLSVEETVRWRRRIQLLAGEQTLLPNIVLSRVACGDDPSVEAVRHLTPGDDSATLRGSVLNSRGSGLPIVGASVSLNCAGCVTNTNEAGEFIFSNLKRGKYTISVSMAGFYRESFRDYLVVKNLDWTYYPILLDKCMAGNCGHQRQPRRPKITYCQ